MMLSVCVPVYNGAATVGRLVEAILSELGPNSGLDDLEIILVNDGSPKDESEAVCAELARRIPEVRFIGLRRNYGEHNAVMCALAHSRGDYAAVIDDDFQNPPSEIAVMLDEAKKGYDVVYARFEKKRHHWFRNWGSRFNNAVAGRLLNKPRGLYLSSFKVISGDLVKEITKYTGPFPYVDGLILRATDSISSVTVKHRDRSEGKSNYTFRKLVNLWIRMFINFSQKPLRIATGTGLFFAAVSLVAAVVFAVQKFLEHESPAGWASLIVAVLFMGSLQLIFLGLLGEYIGKIYLDLNGTPQWTIKTIID